MSRNKSESLAWQYYERMEGNESAKCNKCSAIIQCKGKSTSGLIRHLKNAHKFDEETMKRPSTTELENVNKKKYVQHKIDVFLVKETREEIVAKLASVDGLSAYTIANSKFIRRSLAEKKMLLPSTPSQVMNMVHKQYDIAKERVMQVIAEKVKKGERFSISLDEYTSLRNRRYVNINLHALGVFWNLGMVRIIGSLPADKTVELVEKKLSDFNVNMKNDVIASVTDGASVMVKFGKISHSEHQQCFAHGLHLAVCDVLYKKLASRIEIPVPEQSSIENLSDDDDIAEEDIYTVSAVEISHSDENCTDVINLADSIEGNHEINISVTIIKVRKIVKMFRRSPLKNETLQKYVKLEFHKELNLHLDSKTRWNSLIVMLERFLQLRKSICKALIDLGKQLDVTDQEFDNIDAIIKALQPVKIGVEMLGRRDATLLTAEVVFSFILDELEIQTNPFSMSLKQAIKNRHQERRNFKLVGLLKYLNNPTMESKFSKFSLPSKTTLTAVAKELFGRLFESEICENKINDSEDRSVDLDACSSTEVPRQLSLTEKLDAAMRKEIRNEEEVQRHIGLKSNAKNIAKEMGVYEATGKRTDNLTLLFNALSTIPPTSIESERAFSAVGLFITKIRTRLEDKSIDHLCFLKHYFRAQE